MIGDLRIINMEINFSHGMAGIGQRERSSEKRRVLRCFQSFQGHRI